MATTLDAGALEERARKLLDSRISSVRALVSARQELAELQSQLAHAEHEDARLYAAALKDGWTAEELRQLGLAEPVKKERVRRRQATKRATTTSAPPTETNTQD